MTFTGKNSNRVVGAPRNKGDRMYLAAVFSNGHVATGRHHGEAFSKLSTEDQEAELVSGHVNPDGTFTTELDCVAKDVVLVRHAESEWNAEESESLDSRLTFKGVSQAQAVARFLKNNVDCRGLVGYTSPFDRCIMTSLPIRHQTGIRFFIRPDISELSDSFPDEGVTVPCRKDNYLDMEWGNYYSTTFHREPSSQFIGRLRSFLVSLPDKALVVTHGSIVQTLIPMLLGVNVRNTPAWDNSIGNASVTHIKCGTVIYMAKNVI